MTRLGHPVCIAVFEIMLIFARSNPCLPRPVAKCQTSPLTDCRQFDILSHSPGEGPGRISDSKSSATGVPRAQRLRRGALNTALVSQLSLAGSGRWRSGSRPPSSGSFECAGGGRGLFRRRRSLCAVAALPRSADRQPDQPVLREPLADSSFINSAAIY